MGAHRYALLFAALVLPACDDEERAPDAGAESVVDGGAASFTQTLLAGAAIPKYVDPLPTFAGRRVSATSMAVDIVEFQQRILPASIYDPLPAPFRAGTYLWGYDVNGTGPSFPASTIEAVQDGALTVTYGNHLQGADGSPPVLQQYLVSDQTIHMAQPTDPSLESACMKGPPLPAPCLLTNVGPVPTVVHLHGAQVAAAFDGHPDTWFTPNLGVTGPAYVSNVYSYLNHQEATTLWFHDHALGRVRLNVYAGMLGFYLLRDARDTGLADNPIRLPAGAFEVELAIADRQFDSNGQLFFPNGLPGNPDGLNGPPPNPDVHPYWIPEFFGDVNTVNGKSWPVFDVEPRRYRFRVLDAANSRFYRMQLVDTTSVAFPPPTGGSNPPGPPFWQIGSDGGLLNAPVQLGQLFLAPAERADIIIDFAGQAGRTFTLVNDAEAPFPSGDPPDPGTAGQIMQFRVSQPLSSADHSFSPSSPADAARLRTLPIVDIKPTATRPADVRRQLVLVEAEGPSDDPLEVLLNNSHWDGVREGTSTTLPGSSSNGAGVNATESPRVGSTEIWEIANLTDDAHPIHLHLVQFQLIDRQNLALQAPDGDTIYRADWDAAFPGGSFAGVTYAPKTFIPGYGPPLDYGVPNAAGALGGNPAFVARYFDGAPIAPDANEAGWKDTIKALPKQVTRIAVRYAPQRVPTANVAAGTNLFAFDPSSGPGYVWHCHILDHEDNEMMRPTLITP